MFTNGIIPTNSRWRRMAEQRQPWLLSLFACWGEWRELGEWREGVQSGGRVASTENPFLPSCFSKSDGQNAYTPPLEGFFCWQWPTLTLGVWGCCASSRHTSAVCILLVLNIWPETAIYLPKHISAKDLIKWEILFLLSFYDDLCTRTLRCSSVCFLQMLDLHSQPTSLTSAAPGNQILPPSPLGFITESLFTELNWVTSSHISWKPPITSGFSHLSVLIEGRWK